VLSKGWVELAGSHCRRYSLDGEFVGHGKCFSIEDIPTVPTSAKFIGYPKYEIANEHFDEFCKLIK